MDPPCTPREINENNNYGRRAFFEVHVRVMSPNIHGTNEVGSRHMSFLCLVFQIPILWKDTCFLACTAEVRAAKAFVFGWAVNVTGCWIEIMNH